MKGNLWEQKVPDKLEVGMIFTWGDKQRFEGEIIRINKEGSYGTIKRIDKIKNKSDEIPISIKNWMSKIKNGLVKWEKEVEQLEMNIFSKKSRRDAR